MAPRPLLLVPVRHDGLPGAVLAIGPDGLRCGRTEGQLRFSLDATVSPLHARFAPEADGALLVEDLGSANGTFLRLRSARALRPGDELRLGRQRLRVDPLPAAPAPGAARPWGTSAPDQRACLTQLLDGGGTGEVFALRDGENLLGREAGTIRFPGDRYVSARLEVAGTALLVTDLGSSNGTFVRLTEPTRVAPGDQLLVGMQLVRVEAS